MSKSIFITGYLKWDGKKYIIRNNTENIDGEITVTLDDEKVVYFVNGKCKIVNKN